jgi:hypothetical protein
MDIYQFLECLILDKAMELSLFVIKSRLQQLTVMQFNLFVVSERATGCYKYESMGNN